MHAALLVLAAADVDPAGQLPLHTVAPVFVSYMPALQLKQDDAATDAA